MNAKPSHVHARIRLCEPDIGRFPPPCRAMRERAPRARLAARASSSLSCPGRKLPSTATNFSVLATMNFHFALIKCNFKGLTFLSNKRYPLFWPFIVDERD